jgi:hypothetical protein
MNQPTYEQLLKERDDADRLAGIAARKLEDVLDSQIKRNDWLFKAKKQWGVDDNISFDIVWADALELKQQRDGLLEALQQLDKALNAVFLSDSSNKNINSISLKVAINHAQNIIAKVSK